MLCDDTRDARVVFRLVRVRSSLFARFVLDDDVGRLQRRAHLGVLLLEPFDRPRRRVKDAAPFHLVKDGIVAPVNLVSAVNVRRQEKLFESAAERLDFVCGRVRAQHVSLVEVVRVGQGAAGVVGGETEVVKVLLDGNDGREGVEVLERGKVRLDQGAEDTNRV